MRVRGGEWEGRSGAGEGLCEVVGRRLLEKTMGMEIGDGC